MGHRSLAMLFGAASLLASQMASALGLGEVNLKSSLNQPLDAEIKLLQIRDLTKQEILIGLASRDDFERIGVDRPYFLSDLSFEVDINNASGPIVRVKSTKPVREPFLNFIIQAQWPSGKVLREYTVLLDLPVFADAPAQPVAATQTQGAQRTAEKKPVAQAPKSDTRYNPRSSFDEGRASTNTSAPSQPQSSAYAGVDVIGPVKANQTLWEIAAQVRPDSSVSVQQTMLAIQRLNPDAFINNNINLLKRGQILRIPDASQIKEFTRQEAVRSVAQQNAAWSGKSSAGDVQLSGSKSYTSSSSNSDKAEGRLKLYSPEDSSDAASGRTSGSGSSSTEALESELAITLEQLEKTERDNQEMRSKIESLEDQIQTMERLVEVSNADLRALELAAEKNLQDKANTEGGDSVVPAETEVAESATETTDMAEKPADVVAPPPVKEVPKPEVVEAANKPDPSKVVRTQRKPEPSFVDMLMDNILFVALGLVAIIGAIVLFVRSRGKKDEFEEDDFLEQTTFEAPEANEEDLLSLGDIDTGETESEFEQLEEEAPEEEVSAEAETGDAAAEADIYIAYGKYDQAEEMLVTALEKEPRNIEARLKLLEVYASQNDVHKFDPHFAVIYAEGNASYVERGQQLRAGIADAGEFDADLYVTDVLGETFSGSEESEPSNDDLDFELSLDGEETGTEVEDTATSEADLDFDLGSMEAPTEAQEEESLDFDLDLGGLESTDSDADDSLSLDLDIDDLSESNGDELADLDDLDFDLSLDDVEGAADKPSEEDFSLDFDLDDVSESETQITPAVSDADSKGEVDDGEFDLSEEFLSLGQGSDDTEASSEDELIADNLEEDLDSIDFDLGIEDFNVESVDKPAEEAGGVEAGSLENDLAALDLDLESLELDSGEEQTELSIEADDFDLGTLDDEASLGADSEVSSEVDDLNVDDLSLEGQDDLDDLDLSLDDAADTTLEDIDDSLSLEGDGGEFDLSLEDGLQPASEESAEAGIEFDLGADGLDLENLDVDEPAVEQASVDTELDVADSDDLGEVDELEGDLDLSALDDELDALTGDLDLDDLEADFSEEALAAEVASEDAAEAQPSTLEMEEPVTDFGDLDELDTLGDDLELDSELGVPELDSPELDVPELDSGLEPEKAAEEMGDDTLFTKAISDIPDEDLDFEIPEIDPDSMDDDSDLGFLSDSDETATKLDLARAYIDMGDAEGARDIIEEIKKEGNDQQKEEADKLLSRI
ncbi:FimV/HubP family polar landmark protein [Saccharophagus degradans]|uniref:FimV/HubP family polar landmark protein n=1 Tax=Saccharophagus degradans TaxID=86304 RepID=UPI0024782DFD|nr:FimV/HubP family polar landmark protein [Saccharophagus degradans]WGP00421.1 FimV/HubP family polar landmark protein [Saccharophagus degradans]